ncbi:hypothetical protein [Rheinheimera sp. WS51]|uniref:hypothetical protein n=1 Tax=Rheinheimera sp. WS51 TaxID=3425886 RepID=UPI003D8F6520
MKNPVYLEYQRAKLLGVILIVGLSVLGALSHYLRAVDDGVIKTKQQLNTASSQLNEKFNALQSYATALQSTAQLKLLAVRPIVDAEVAVLSFSDAQTIKIALDDEQDPFFIEANMLQQLQPYFDLISQVQPFISNIYYVSEQNVAFNGLSRWPDYIAEQMLSWHSGFVKSQSFNRENIFHSTFIQQQSLLQVPLYENDKILGRFLFALDLKSLLKPVYSLYPQNDLMLLDQAGNLIANSTSRALPEIEQQMMHVQRLTNTPWSLAILAPKTSLFASGFKVFIIHFISYLVLLSLLFSLMNYRFKRRVVSPINRLFIHIERLASSDTDGVRHIPLGWNDIFDKVYRLTQQNNSKQQ